MSGRITPDEISDGRLFTFRGVRLGSWERGGYDETEVDEFLDEVAAQTADDMRTISEVRSRCEAVLARAKTTAGERRLALSLLTLIALDLQLEPLPADEAVAS